MTTWLVTFVLTLLIEVVVAYPLLGLEVRSRRARLLAIVVANVLTHPVVFTVASVLVPRSLWCVPVLEVGATVVEALVYMRLLSIDGSRPRLPAIFASCFANAASFVGCYVFWST
ncbi:MAG: hypothetical protein H0U00_14170 [Actinobacteria bacterium]|nr:hypothetical protein [Actinomycetota bacterium]